MRPHVTFEQARAQADEMGETNDCTVICLTVVTGESYAKCHATLKELGRRRRCGTSHLKVIKALELNGMKSYDVSKFYGSASVRSIVPRLPTVGKFMVLTAKHILAVVNGVCQDWSKYKKLYVEQVFMVLEADEEFRIPATPPAVLLREHVPVELPITKQVWWIAELLYAQEKVPATSQTKGYWAAFRAKVIEECKKHGIHETTATVQVGKWCKNNVVYFKVT